MNTYEASIKEFEGIIKSKKTVNELKISAAQKLVSAHVHHHNYELALDAVRVCETLGDKAANVCHRKVICHTRLGRTKEAADYAREIELGSDMMYNMPFLAAKIEYFKIMSALSHVEYYLRYQNFNMASKYCYACENMHYQGEDLHFYKFECVLELQGVQPALLYAKEKNLKEKHKTYRIKNLPLCLVITLSKYHTTCEDSTLVTDELMARIEELTKDEICVYQPSPRVAKAKAALASHTHTVHQKIKKLDLLATGSKLYADKIRHYKSIIDLFASIDVDSHSEVVLPYILKLAGVYQLQNSYNDAIMLVRTAADGDDEDALRIRRNCYEKLGKYDQAREDADKVFKLSRHQDDRNALNQILATINLMKANAAPFVRGRAGPSKPSAPNPEPVAPPKAKAMFIRNRDACKLLGVSPDVAFVEISSAYRKKTRIYHPDKNQGKSKEELEQLKMVWVKIQEAHSILKAEEEAFGKKPKRK